MANDDPQVQPFTELLIQSAIAAMRAPRGRSFIHAAGRGMQVRTPGEKIHELCPGVRVRVSTDDSGVATQVEENDKLHAILRPKPINPLLQMRGGR